VTEELVYQVKLEVFEGPFDLLLKAIDEGKIDIYRVSIAQIVSSYFEYWKAAEPSLVMACDFLYLAAYLLELKSRALLPAREENLVEEIETEETLSQHIQEYEVYQQIASSLQKRKEIFDRVFSREGEEKEIEFELVGVSLRDLVVAFKRVYEEALARERIISIPKEEITLEDRIMEIKHLLAGRKDGVPFEDLFLRRTRLEVIVTFLALLELVKQRVIYVLQNRHFGSILIFAVPLVEREQVEVNGSCAS
jgi:segregation and condensation protein A